MGETLDCAHFCVRVILVQTRLLSCFSPLQWLGVGLATMPCVSRNHIFSRADQVHMVLDVFRNLFESLFLFLTGSRVDKLARGCYGLEPSLLLYSQLSWADSIGS